MAGPGNSINATTTGIVGFTGTGFVGTAVTQYNTLIGASTSSTLTNVAPSATSGVPLISQGSASNPTYSTIVVAGGGTGNVSDTAYAVICGGTTSTGVLQSVASVGTSGQVLTSNGASALPTFQTISATSAFDQIVIQVFSATGTYTPTTGMKYAILECLGGGGGGGGVGSTAGTVAAGGGGGAGGYARIVSTAATIGASKAVTIGAAGTAGSSAGGGGGTGGSTSVGTICVAAGGNGGGAGSIQAGGGSGGTGTTGTILVQGNSGGACITVNATGWVIVTQGQGAGGRWGGAPIAGGSFAGGSAAGNAPGATGYGSGGCGASGANSATGQAGGAGAKGYVRIIEFISV